MPSLLWHRKTSNFKRDVPMFKTIALLGALLALQAGGLDYYYRTKLSSGEKSPRPTCEPVEVPLSCEQARAEVAAELAAAAAANASAVAQEMQAVLDAKKPRLVVLDADARIFLMHNFLTDAESDHMIHLATPHLKRSGVVETETGNEKVDNVRTSKGMFLSRGQDDVIAAIEKRIAEWTLMPVENGEGIQVLQYQIGQEYEGHYDYFFHKEGTSNGGNRYLTVLMYMADVEEGGETCFPNVPAPNGDNGPEFSDCARKHLCMKPKKGDALLFHSIKPTGELERRSLHAACPVIKGQKWSSAKWVHVGRYAVGGEQAVAIEQFTQVDQEFPNCKNVHNNCESWAGSGECDKNPVWMIGTKEKPGNCIKACGKCGDIYEPTPHPEAHLHDHHDH